MNAVATIQDNFRPGISPPQVNEYTADRKGEFIVAFQEALNQHNLMSSEADIDPIDPQTWEYAWQSLSAIAKTHDLPPPLVSPLQGGGVGAEWHDRGMNIELRFRAPYKVYAVIEDTLDQIQPLSDFDPHFAYVLPALQNFSRRKGR
jgi:hypothetical protein